MGEAFPYVPVPLEWHNRSISSREKHKLLNLMYTFV